MTRSLDLPRECAAAVFVGGGRPLEIRRFEVPRSLEPGAAI
ncbi:MAG TPA: hypothetical protein VM492_15420 [Sumerlaeia bacterium]|nr:hypothetical protein [Sumerlaeia bacterium]